MFHQYIAFEMGGGVGLRDEGLLESALESAPATFGSRILPGIRLEKTAVAHTLNI